MCGVSRILDLGERKKRISIIGALHISTFFAPFFFEGTCERAIFAIYLEQILLKNVPMGTTFIFDNATIHKGSLIEDIIRNAGCYLLYLPPYSPDLNPIEHFWSSIKYRLRNILKFETSDIFNAAIIAFSHIST